jgi:hypothetical protein
MDFGKDSYVIPQPKYLLDRASTGIFYLLANREQEIASSNNRNPFRRDFGHIYREYVAMQFRSVSESMVFVDLDTDFIHDGKFKTPDFAILDGNDCILIEVKTSLLGVESRTYFDNEKLLSEVQNGSIRKAVEQLDSFRERILNKQICDDRFSKIERVINILVGYEDVFVLNSSLLPILEQCYSKAVLDMQLCSISDIDAMGTILQQGGSVVSLLVEKVDSEERKSWMIAEYLKEYIENDNVILKDNFKEFFERFSNEDLG